VVSQEGCVDLIDGLPGNFGRCTVGKLCRGGHDEAVDFGHHLEFNDAAVDQP